MKNALYYSEDVYDAFESKIHLGHLSTQIGPICGMRVLLSFLSSPNLLHMCSHLQQNISKGFQLFQFDD